MKKTLTRLLIVGLIFTSSHLLAQSLTFEPEHPAPGETVTLYYHPDNGLSADRLSAVVYLLEGEMPVAKEIMLTAQGDFYRGELTTNEATKALVANVVIGEQKTDNNNGKGYRSKLYQSGTEEPVEGALVALAEAYGNWSNTLDIDRDYERAMKYMTKAFQRNPELKKDYGHLLDYARFAKDLEDEAALREVQEKAQQITEMRKPGEEELMFAYNLYRRLENKEKAESLAERIKKKYPKGELAMQELVNKFYKEKDPAQKEALFEKYTKMASEDDRQMANRMAATMARTYGADNLEKAEQYLAKVEDPSDKASALNSIAFNMAGAGLEQEGQQLEKAEEFSAHSLEILQAIEENPGDERPSYYTDQRWQQTVDYYTSMYADTYALILFKQGNYDKAFKYQKKACKASDFGNAELNERYAIFMEEYKGAEKTIAALEDLIRQNKATAKMKEQYHRLFVNNFTLEEAADQALAVLEEAARLEFRKELKEKMLDKPAPEFALKDLDGKEVSLADMKGKVVVIDFWATWCGPCVNSFPGMQKAVDKYKDDDKVAFLFIDTWESAADKRQNAADFIEKNDYTFHVLLDTESKVVSKFKVSGIPTKFVLDGDGNIRFKSVGFDGNIDKLVDELSIMIELAKGASKKGTAVSMIEE